MSARPMASLDEAPVKFRRIDTRGHGIIHHGGVAPMEELGGMNILQLAHLARHPEHPALEIVDGECSQSCGTPIRASRLFMGLTACDACRAKAEEDEAMKRAKTHWEAICPPAFRDTNKLHADFPKAQLEQLSDWTGQQSLFFYGDTRAGKTRLAMLMLKRAMLKNHFVGVIWPEELDDASKGFEGKLSKLHEWARYDVLLLDDALLTCAGDEKTSTMLKNLLDLLIRQKKRFIITSQIGGDDWKEQAKQYVKKGERVTETSIARIDAAMGRIREECRVIPFVKPVAADGEAHF